MKTLWLCTISFALILGCTNKKAQVPDTSLSCTGYTWSDVETLVAPHVSDELYTSLVMQAQSSEYKVSAAADHALGISDAYPDSVISLLKKLQELDC